MVSLTANSDEKVPQQTIKNINLLGILLFLDCCPPLRCEKTCTGQVYSRLKRKFEISGALKNSLRFQISVQRKCEVSINHIIVYDSIKTFLALLGTWAVILKVNCQMPGHR